jgi:RND superfamily putative drug exporter
VILAAWLAIAAVALPFGGKLSSTQKNDAVAFLPRGAESTGVQQQLDQLNQNQDLTAVIVYRRVSGLTPADRDRAAADRATLAQRFLPGRQVPRRSRRGTAKRSW